MTAELTYAASPSRGTTQTVPVLAFCDQLVSMSSTGLVHVLQMICRSTTAASSFSAADLVLKPLTVDQPSTFELACARAVAAGQFSAIIVVVYRPGSAPVQQLFFDELGAVLEQRATYSAPVYIAGDLNIRLDRPDDPHSVQLRSLVNFCGLMLHHTAATHRLGGILDVVITKENAG